MRARRSAVATGPPPGWCLCLWCFDKAGSPSAFLGSAIIHCTDRPPTPRGRLTAPPPRPAPAPGFRPRDRYTHSMTPRQLTLLSPYRLPTDSTLYMGDEEVGAILNGHAALWHPAALAVAAGLPRLAQPYDHEEPAGQHVYG